MTTIDSTTARNDDLIIALWRYIDETGNIVARPLTAAEYDRLAELLPAERAVILDCKSLDYPVCETCGGDGFVTVVVERGSWASYYGPDYDERTEPCPHCGVDAGDDYTDDDLDALYAETMAEAVA